MISLMVVSISSQEFEVNQSGFYKDGEIYRIMSGSIHYARIPEAYWEDRLIKARAMGLNTISTYVFWNFHEEEEGSFNFTTGRKNLRHFIELAAAHDLNVILRPGPYISGDWDMGGIPNWLLAKGNVKFRSDDVEFMNYTKKYLAALMFSIEGLQYSKGGPIIMMQLENEYGSFGNDKNYLQNIKLLYDEAGIEVPLYTTDAAELARLESGSIEEILPSLSFTYDPEDNFETLKQFNPSVPQFAGEYRIGRSTSWDDIIQKDNKQAKQLKGLKWMLKNNKSFNLYMFHGGTNFGFWAGANYINGEYHPVQTSHDYGAPLAEDGSITKEYKKIRNLLKDYQNLGETTLPEVPKDPKPGRIKRIKFNYFSRLIENIPENPQLSSMPLSQENFGQRTGVIIYKTILRGQKSGNMVIEAPHDIAHVYLNKKYITTLYRNDGRYAFELPRIKSKKKKEEKEEIELELIIIVESLGRISFGPELMDRKGITKYVTLNEVNVMNWEVTPIPFTEEYLSSLHYYDNRIYEEPVIFAATFEVKRIGSTWLQIGKWSSGIIVVNGKVVGRYRDKSPQKSLYLPGSWLQEGLNTIYILDMGMENLPSIKLK